MLAWSMHASRCAVGGFVEQAANAIALTTKTIRLRMRNFSERTLRLAGRRAWPAQPDLRHPSQNYASLQSADIALWSYAPSGWMRRIAHRVCVDRAQAHGIHLNRNGTAAALVTVTSRTPDQVARRRARFIPANSSLEPAPHFEITLMASVKGTSTGCTRAFAMM